MIQFLFAPDIQNVHCDTNTSNCYFARFVQDKEPKLEDVTFFYQILFKCYKYNYNAPLEPNQQEYADTADQIIARTIILKSWIEYFYTHFQYDTLKYLLDQLHIIDRNIYLGYIIWRLPLYEHLSLVPYLADEYISSSEARKEGVPYNDHFKSVVGKDNNPFEGRHLTSKDEMERDHPMKNFNTNKTSIIDNKYKDQVVLLHDSIVRQIKTEYFIKSHCTKDNDHKDMLDSIIWQYEDGYPFENSHKRSLQHGYLLDSIDTTQQHQQTTTTTMMINMN
ncbi:hypothetical protein DFA_07657 [Cavenderia fasciculata]|uniref:Uncharacterized protein n=1 Tax=Cavenderia fasciculata TaxID=261658 RepID=F4Q2K0_CACFS|nr:uncharacterized protein DFA_07657 [Cavenderia fasciculata]EGG16679.1 hypothetical protein DFA_07657 [Cavenderia fasciculata]|eukprot:XP_004355153.1 hypothetical protein DFA_07657 [Cavenderia fasciculata]